MNITIYPVPSLSMSPTGAQLLEDRKPRVLNNQNNKFREIESTRKTKGSLECNKRTLSGVSYPQVLNDNRIFLIKTLNSIKPTIKSFF